MALTLGISDYVKCFFCDGGLCEWEPDDDPWTEHALWFGDCEFLQLNKGTSFVQSCQKLEKRKLDREMKTSSLTDDEKAVKAVESWLDSDLVKQLQKIQSFDTDSIKAALHQRWLDRQQPYEHLSDLIAAVVELKSIPRYLFLNLAFLILANHFSYFRLLRYNSKTNETDDDSFKDTESFSSLSLSSPSPQNSNKSGERIFCKICLDKEVGVLFLPCGHVVACTQCAPGFTECPICRKMIKSIVRTYFS